MEREGTFIHDFDPNLISDYFGRLDRQGPGSSESTIKALSFIDNLSNTSEIADLACGTGGQTITIAQNTEGTIIGLDISSQFIEKFNENVKNNGLENRVKGIVGSMEKLPFDDKKFDVIWSEGAIANIGFMKGLQYWKRFLKEDGYIAVTYESWFTEERPAEIEKFWVDAVPEISTVDKNISAMQRAGYSFIASFALPETCWIDTYFKPQREIQRKFLEDNVNSKAAKALVEGLKYEEELYEKYRQYYGYVFYIGKKVKN